MDQNFLDLLLKTIDDLKVELKADIKDLRAEVYGLNAFKWKVVGIATFLNIIITIAVTIFAAYISKGG